MYETIRFSIRFVLLRYILETSEKPKGIPKYSLQMINIKKKKQIKYLLAVLKVLIAKYSDTLVHWMWISIFQCYEHMVFKWFYFSILFSVREEKKIVNFLS